MSILSISLTEHLCITKFNTLAFSLWIHFGSCCNSNHVGEKVPKTKIDPSNPFEFRILHFTNFSLKHYAAFSKRELNSGLWSCSTLSWEFKTKCSWIGFLRHLSIFQSNCMSFFWTLSINLYGNFYDDSTYTTNFKILFRKLPNWKKCPLEKLSEFDDVSFFDASPSVSFQYNSE